MSSSSSIVTPPITPRAVMNPALLERVVALLNEYLDTLQSEQHAIEENSPISHDEMAADDQHWDELDAQIGELRDVLSQLGFAPQSDDTDSE
jgi:hypothetical protein